MNERGEEAEEEFDSGLIIHWNAGGMPQLQKKRFRARAEAFQSVSPWFDLLDQSIGGYLWSTKDGFERLQSITERSGAGSDSMNQHARSWILWPSSVWKLCKTTTIAACVTKQNLWITMRTQIWSQMQQIQTYAEAWAWICLLFRIYQRSNQATISKMEYMALLW